MEGSRWRAAGPLTVSPRQAVGRGAWGSPGALQAASRAGKGSVTACGAGFFHDAAGLSEGRKAVEGAWASPL